MDAVCFDMDGVLVDSEDFWEPWETGELFPRLLPDDEVAVEEITGLNYRDIYDYLADSYDVTMGKDEFLDWYDATAREIYGEEVGLLDGFPALRETLRDREVRVALVSSSPPHWIDVVVERFGLDFDEVVSADTLDGPGKPEPHIYRHACDQLGVAPEQTIAVEDSGHGIASARRAGTHVVGFRQGSGMPDGDEVDYLAASAADLRRHVRELTG